jgi:hypothetical protein
MLRVMPSDGSGEGHSAVSRARQQAESSFSGLWCRFSDRVYARSWHGLWTSLLLKVLHFNLDRADIVSQPVESTRDWDWFICTDQTEADYLTLRTYSRRMWIEELFGDLEDGGFRLNRSRLYQPERLSRLVMALAWAYVWLMHVGVWAVKRGFRRLVDRADRRDRSYPEIGRRYLQRCMTNGKPIHIGLKPYFWKLSGS